MAITSVVLMFLVVTLKAISTTGTPIVTGPLNGLTPHQGEPMSSNQQTNAFSQKQLNCHSQTSLSSFSVASQQEPPLLSPRNGVQELAWNPRKGIQELVWDMADGNGSSCSLTVHKTQPNVCFLSIFVEIFSVQQSEDCMDGWLEIDGQKLCGNIGDNIELSSNFSDDKQIIKFVNNQLLDPVFNLIVRQVNCKTKQQSKRGELEALQTCSKQLVGNGFLLQSPNYPDLYPPYQDCVTEIQTKKNKLIIRFDEFFLEPSIDCSKDYLEVINENPLSPNKKLCGFKTGYLQVDVTYSTRFVFHSDNQTGGRYSFYVETQKTSTQPNNGRTVSLEATPTTVTTEKSFKPIHTTTHIETPIYSPSYSTPTRTAPTHHPSQPRPPYHPTESTLLHPCTQVFTTEPSLHSPNNVRKSVNTYQPHNVYRPPYNNQIGRKYKVTQQNIYRPPYNPCKIPQNVYRPPNRDTQVIYRPPYDIKQNVYRPPHDIKQIVNRPIYSTTQKVYRPPYGSTQNIYRPPYSTDRIVSITSTSTQRTTTPENAVIIGRCGQGKESENCIDEDETNESTTVTNVIPEEGTEKATNIDIEYNDSINIYDEGSGDSVEEGNIPTPARI